MHYKSIVYVLGYVLMIIGVLMLLPVVTGLIYGEYFCTLIFLAVGAGSALVGFLLTRLKVRFSVFTAKDGYVSVALGWLLISAVGALPFTLSGEIPFYLDALFEIVSGFTTTGSSILSDVEALSNSCLLYTSPVLGTSP